MCPLFGRLARALNITRNPYCRWCHPLQEEGHAPTPPPEPPPATPPRRTRLRPNRSTSTCPICKLVYTSVTTMKRHAKRVHPGEMIIEEGLVCGYCSSTKVFKTSASRAGHYRKCADYQRITHSHPTTPVETQLQNQQHVHEDICPGPKETLSHMLWECPRLRDLSIATFGTDPVKLKVPFNTKLLYGFLTNAITLFSTDCYRD
ncbi:uncharacterized protein TM35_000601230 [Trypanosoma theileri]|uniref:C2H2-type domain-containing protein n=1 Tax=Trypanosoma theileri TaxID=67003 RepID=A0A1X0NG42_9TRYP|nr:uncharacterized protein TM35_000601230 [Trypanosoma theileri]ORC83692.1 hypothetical protein TM35_000601230 [Trypanosoma theileri]